MRTPPALKLGLGLSLTLGSALSAGCLPAGSGGRDSDDAIYLDAALAEPPPARPDAAPSACVDRDGDGEQVAREAGSGADCGPVDCDDGDPYINRRGVEICGNGIDEDCDGEDPPCCEPNGCGGCEPLDAPLGDACGACGLGEIVCDGPDETRCADPQAGDRDGDGACDDEDPCPNDAPDDPDGDGLCGEPIETQIVIDDASPREIQLSDYRFPAVWGLGNVITLDRDLGGEFEGREEIRLTGAQVFMNIPKPCFYTLSVRPVVGGRPSRRAIAELTIHGAQASRGWISPRDPVDVRLSRNETYLISVRPNGAACHDPSNGNSRLGVARTDQPDLDLGLGRFERLAMYWDDQRFSDYPDGPTREQSEALAPGLHRLFSDDLVFKPMLMRLDIEVR